MPSGNAIRGARKWFDVRSQQAHKLLILSYPLLLLRALPCPQRGGAFLWVGVEDGSLTAPKFRGSRPPCRLYGLVSCGTVNETVLCKSAETQTTIAIKAEEYPLLDAALQGRAKGFDGFV